MAHINILVSSFLLFLQCYLALAQDKPCGGHNVKIDYFRNCAEPKSHNIKIQNLTFTVTDDCKIIPRGCIKVKKAIPAAKVEYSVSKPPLKKKGNEDLCKSLQSPETQKTLESYKSFPRKCTIPAGDHCINKGSTTIEQLNPRTLNLLTGTTTGYFMVSNEGSQDKACIEFKLTVSKK